MCEPHSGGPATAGIRARRQDRCVAIALGLRHYYPLVVLGVPVPERDADLEVLLVYLGKDGYRKPGPVARGIGPPFWTAPLGISPPLVLSDARSSVR